MSYTSILSKPGFCDLEIDHNTADNTIDIDATIEDRACSFTLQVPDVIILRDYLNTLNLGEP